MPAIDCSRYCTLQDLHRPRIQSGTQNLAVMPFLSNIHYKPFHSYPFQCTDCAEADRGTCMHEKWSAGGAPHEWEIVDRQPEARVKQKRVRNRAVSNRMALD